MNILVFNSTDSYNNIYNIISEFYKNIFFTNINDHDAFLDEYQQKTYDIVIIDLSLKNADQILHEITRLNPEQKILTILNGFKYSNHLDCKSCHNRYNRRRLLRPINISDLIEYLLNFDNTSCYYSNECNHIEDILEYSLKRFLYYKLDFEKRKIICQTTSGAYIQELTKIIDILNIHNLEFQIEHDHHISLTDL